MAGALELRGRRRRRWWASPAGVTGLLAIALICLLAGPSSAIAAALPGPSTFFPGLTDDALFQYSSNATRLQWLSRARSIGSTEVRIDVTWTSVAPYYLPASFDPSNPGDPAYNWTNLDATVRAAVANHQTPLLQLYSAPAWAEAAGGPPRYTVDGSWEPNATAYGAFAHAVALRYSGHFPDPLNPGRDLPRVTDFQAWNEPNLPQYLMPQWVRGPRNSIVAASPGIYRSMLSAFYAGIKSAVASDYVVAAGTAPYGDPPGVDRMQPLTFLRGLLCLTTKLGPAPCPNPAHFDALSHHPYALTPTASARIPGDVSVPDLGQIWSLIHAAQRYKRALPAGHKSLWVTELDWSTQTHVRQPITLAEQARYLSLAFYELWTEDVSHIFWFNLRDPTAPGHSTQDTGLYLLNGAAKPSEAAFRFPFVALSAAAGQRIIWGKAPFLGTVTIQRAAGRGWDTVLQLRTTGNGVFYDQVALDQSWRLRAEIHGVTSPTWAGQAKPSRA